MAGTRAQSCDPYGSGTLHPGQVLGGCLPLLSPAFKRSHFRHQVPVRPQQRERSQQRKVELWARNCPVILPKFRLPRKFRDLLHASNLRHGTDGFTSPPKEGVLRIFFALKIRRLRPYLGTKDQNATPRHILQSNQFIEHNGDDEPYEAIKSNIRDFHRGVLEDFTLLGCYVVLPA